MSSPQHSFPTSLETNEIPDIYDRFARLVDDRRWIRRVEELKAEIRGNPFLRDYFREEFEIVYGLERCCQLMRRHGAAFGAVVPRELYPTLAFASQATALIEGAPSDLRNGLLGRFRGAIHDPTIMRGLRLELAAATSLTHNGYTLDWPETSQTGRFDLLARSATVDGLEVECKAISQDKGKKVHRRAALTLQDLVKQETKGLLKGLKTGLSVVLTLTDRLPGDYSARKELAVGVRRQILSNGSGTLPDGTTVRIAQFDVRAHALFDEHGRPVQDTIDLLTGTRNEHSLLAMNPAGTGALVVVAKSARDDPFPDYLTDTLKDAADKQLTGSRAGLLIVGLDSLSESELLEVSAHDRDNANRPTLLRIAAHNTMRSEQRRHVVGVGYFSREGQAPEAGGLVRAYGGVYFFPNTDSPYWREEFAHLFRSRVAEQAP